MTDKGDIIKTTDIEPRSKPFECVNDPKEQTLAEYLYKRITEDFTGAHMHHITKDVIDASDIDRYIREYNLHKNNKSSFYDYAEKPKSSETLIDKGFGYSDHDESVLMDGEHGMGYYDAPRRVEVYESDSGAEYVREEQERILEEKKKSNKALHKKWMKEGLTELAKTIEPKKDDNYKKARDEALSKSFAAKLVPWDHMGDDEEEQRPSYESGVLDNRPYAERTEIFPIKRNDENKD